MVTRARARTRARRFTPTALTLSGQAAVLAPTPATFGISFAPVATLAKATAKPRLQRNWIWICPAVMLVVGVIDTACTLAALRMGVLIELNPIMALMIDKGGPLGLVTYRLGVTLLGCGLLLWALRMYRDGRIPGAAHSRTRGMIWFGQAFLVATHLALATWWTAWFVL